FNGTQGSCNNTGGRTGETAFEPGSGATIMSLGGVCGSDNIVTARAARFHSGSLAQIVEYVDSFGGTVGTASSTGNAPPAANAGADYVIPKQTAFTLTGTVSDPAGQALAYAWEQIDAGASAFANPPYGDQTSDPAETTRPLFHPQAPVGPVTSGSLAMRTFAGLTPGGFLMAESLPTIGRALNFRLTARDNQSAGGGVSSDTARVEVVGTAGPFSVLTPNTNVSWMAGSMQTVTWQVSNTNVTPINCATVNIMFSADGGLTFGVLARGTPNDGSETITVPSINTTLARIKIEAVGNIFFDISDANFTVSGAVECGYLIGPTDQSFLPGVGTGSVSVVSGAGCGWTATSNAIWITINSGTPGSGNGSVSYSVAANTGTLRTGTITIGGQTFTVTQSATASTLVIDTVIPAAGRTTGGQQIRLTGSFITLSSVTVGGVSASWTYSNGTSEVTVTIPAHASGAVNIDLTPTSGSAYSKSNAFAFLPTIFTDDTLVVGVTTAKAQHIIELRQAVDALRAVAGLTSAPWTDSTLLPSSTLIKAVHITELRTYLENAAGLLGYSAGSYTDPALSSGFLIKRLHIEELRQRIRTIAG
ncbi:MAG: hypothetical protein M3X11_25720, partial [Acidobacteriota bacterium]|nr:hypothetical protein [Acidobacteriota bacterium]